MFLGPGTVFHIAFPTDTATREKGGYYVCEKSSGGAAAEVIKVIYCRQPNYKDLYKQSESMQLQRTVYVHLLKLSSRMVIVQMILQLRIVIKCLYIRLYVVTI